MFYKAFMAILGAAAACVVVVVLFGAGLLSCVAASLPDNPPAKPAHSKR